MNISCRPYTHEDVTAMQEIWNEIVLEGTAFPQEFVFTIEEADLFFHNQTATICAVNPDTGSIAGFYILHDNNVGRCSHIANASYGVSKNFQHQGVGKVLVNDSLKRAKESGYNGIQYNAVVKTNYSAITLYLKLDFEIVGTVPDGFRMKDGMFEDTLIFYKKL